MILHAKDAIIHSMNLEVLTQLSRKIEEEGGKDREREGKGREGKVAVGRSSRLPSVHLI